MVTDDVDVSVEEFKYVCEHRRQDGLYGWW